MFAFTDLSPRRIAQAFSVGSNRKTGRYGVNGLPAPFAALPCCQCDPASFLPVFTSPQGQALCGAKASEGENT